MESNNKFKEQNQWNQRMNLNRNQQNQRMNLKNGINGIKE